MPLGTFVAGRYSASYDPTGATTAADLGLAEKGYELQVTYKKELITDTDAYAQTPVDAIYQGSEVFLQSTFKEWKAGILNAIFPYQSIADGVFLPFGPTGAQSFHLGVIGRLDTNIDGILILTSTTATPAALSPATLTATHSMFAENFDIRAMFGPTLRKPPARWRIYPYIPATVPVFFTAT